MKKILGAAALTVALSLSIVSAGAQDEAEAEIPVLGTFTYPNYGKASGVPVIGAVHGARRVEGATAVYYSVATRSDSGQPLAGGLAFEPRSTPYKILQASAVEISDPVSLIAYRPLLVDELGGLVSEIGGLGGDPGEFVVVYALLPELPASTTTVDLQFEWGVSVTDVPVEHGALTPEVQADFVPLGEGWPALPGESIVAQADPERSTYKVLSRSGDVEQSSKKLETSSDVSITLAADFFFDSGQWKLSTKGVEKVKSMAAEIAERESSAILVTGYTDSVPDQRIGNVELSKLRAKTVADLITSEIPGVKVTAEGRGEADPIGSNSTDEGRAQNRRVTVDYEVGQ